MATRIPEKPPPVTDWTDWLRFRCTGCGNCCKGTIVMLTDADVRRIALGTGMAPKSFVRFFDEKQLRMAKRHPFWIRLATRRRAMALRWGRDRCVFLDREDRCSIYDHRPLACREHPFTITLGSHGAVRNLQLSKVAECLYDLDGHVTRRQLASVSRWNERESEAYQARVRAWNRRPAGPPTRAAFMKHLGMDWEQEPRPARGEPSAPSPFG